MLSWLVVTIGPGAFGRDMLLRHTALDVMSLPGFADAPLKRVGRASADSSSLRNGPDFSGDAQPNTRDI